MGEGLSLPGSPRRSMIHKEGVFEAHWWWSWWNKGVHHGPGQLTLEKEG